MEVSTCYHKRLFEEVNNAVTSQFFSLFKGMKHCTGILAVLEITDKLIKLAIQTNMEEI